MTAEAAAAPFDADPDGGRSSAPLIDLAESRLFTAALRAAAALGAADHLAGGPGTASSPSMSPPPGCPSPSGGSSSGRPDGEESVGTPGSTRVTRYWHGLRRGRRGRTADVLGRLAAGTSPTARIDTARAGTATTLTRLKSAVEAERAVRERQGVLRRRHLTEQRAYAGKSH
ncbi:hypothetical protein ACIRQY_22465 [Streptomyces sp. NPDC101490]|uniref:hypothetical protein n=1 Tax=Streptomyces sp. NPDC101490 TaxID=3366143 RepID=UPI0037F7B2C1